MKQLNCVMRVSGLPESEYTTHRNFDNLSINRHDLIFYKDVRIYLQACDIFSSLAAFSDLYTNFDNVASVSLIICNFTGNFLLLIEFWLSGGKKI